MLWLFIPFAILLLAAIGLWITLQHGSLPFIRLRRKPKHGQIRVACVGDSITYGYGIKNWVTNNYPSRLGHLLGKGYCVQNFGVCGATASLTGDLPYEKTSSYRNSLLFSPDIVLVILGTNDSKPGNYRGIEAYTEDLRRLVLAYCSLPEHPKMILMTPPPVWGSPVPFEIDGEVIERELRPAVKEISQEEQIPCIDLYTTFENHPALFWDGVHPNAAGAQRIAESVIEHFKEEKQS